MSQQDVATVLTENSNALLKTNQGIEKNLEKNNELLAKLVENQVANAEISKSKEEIEKSMEAKMEAKVAEITKSLEEKNQVLEMKVEEFQKSNKKQGQMITGTAGYNELYEDVSKSYTDIFGQIASQQGVRPNGLLVSDFPIEYINKSIALYEEAGKRDATSSLKGITKAVHNYNDYALGGALVNAPIVIGLQDRLYLSSSVRRYARVISGSERQITLNITTRQAVAEFMNSSEDYPQTTAGLIGDKTITAIKCGLAIELEQDFQRFYNVNNKLGINLTSWVIDKMASAIADREDVGYIYGQSKIKGGEIEAFIPQTNDEMYEKIEAYTFQGQKVGFVKSGLVNGFKEDAFSFLESVLPSEFMGRAKLIMHPKTIAYIKRFKDNEGMPLLNQNIGEGLLNGLIRNRFYGFDIIADRRFPTINAGGTFDQNTLPIFFGDPAEYYTVYDAFETTPSIGIRQPNGKGQLITIVGGKYSTGIRQNPQAGIFLKITN